MRAVVQRAKESKVTVEGETVGSIGKGLVVFLGVTEDDEYEDLRYLANKVSALRVFEDDEGKMNLSVKDIGGEVLCVSQFTLYGDARKGNRPSFIKAADPQKADSLYQDFCEYLRQEKNLTVETGQFQAMMQVDVSNDGPVTLLLDSRKLF